MSTRALFTLLFAAFAVDVAAHGPSRQKVTETITIQAPAAKVWGVIADFCAISAWHPAVAKCVNDGGNTVGAKRTLNIDKADGPRIVEELQAHDPAGMMYRYKVVKTDNAVLPVTTYSAFVTVKDNGDKTTTVEWRSGFYRAYTKNDPPLELNDEAAVKAVTGVYKTGLANLKKLAEK